ncbi:MAG: serine hydrolase domain-containing protein [Moraxellaceae bacterium]|nr:serine hydrolase domain-containing protein [Moraxellaceae bacterium]
MQHLSAFALAALVVASPAWAAGDVIVTPRGSLTGPAPFRAPPASPAPLPASASRVAPMAAEAASATTLSATGTTPCWVSKSLAATGTYVDALKSIDGAVKTFIRDRQIPAANLVVRYKGTVVLERGYGWQDSACKTKMGYGGSFRLASLTKMLTNAQVYALEREGKLRLSDPVFCVSGQSRCILTVPGLVNVDPRLAQVTVQHLLDHTGGLNASISGNPTDDVRLVATNLGVPSPPARNDIIRHHLSNRTLDFAPGTQQHYSNFGYVVLGGVIEKAAGKSYVAYLQQSVLQPLGIAASDIKIAGTRTADLDTREPWYSTPNEPGQYRNVYDNGPLNVPLAYGGFHIESGGGAGMLQATARAYSKFLSAHWISGVRKSDFPCYCLYLFYGSIPGSFVVAYQPNPDVDIALFFNQRDDANDPWGERYGPVRDALDVALAKVTSWPTKAPSGHQP